MEQWPRHLANGNVNALQGGNFVENYLAAITQEDGYEPSDDVIAEIQALALEGTDIPGLDDLIAEVAPDPEVIDLNHLNNTNGVQTVFHSTDGPDVFMDDFSNNDGSNDTNTIIDFNPTEDTLIFTNADAAFDGSTQTSHREDEVKFRDEETEGDTTHGHFVKSKMVVRVEEYTEDAQTGQYEEAADTIIVTDSKGEPVRLPLVNTDDETMPVVGTVANVYQGDANLG